MNITVKSYNDLKTLTHNLPDGGRLAFPEGETVSGVLEFLTVPLRKQSELVLFVNGRLAHLETSLADGDILVFFSSFTGG